MAEASKAVGTLNNFFDLIRRNERKRIPLVTSVQGATVDSTDIGPFIEALNTKSFPTSLAAELIDIVWPRLDLDCKNLIIRDWLDGRDKDVQVGGFHVLAARLLSHDDRCAMTLIDRVTKLAAISEPCRRRAFSTTCTDWIGDALSQTRYRSLTIQHLSERGRLVLLSWLTDACLPEFKPTDPESRRSDLRRQAEGRKRVLAEWMFQKSKDPTAPTFVVDALNAQLIRLGHVPRSVSPQTEPATPQQTAPAANETKVPEVSSNSAQEIEPKVPPSGPPKSLGSTDQAVVTASPVKHSPTAEIKPSVGLAAPPAAAKKLREALSSVEHIFGRELEQHSKELQAVVTELNIAREEATKAKQDAAAHRDRANKSLEWTTELEKELEAVKSAGDGKAQEAEQLRGKLDRVGKELEELTAQNRSLREESREAIAREMARERDRLLMQVGQRIGNIVSNYREVRARGALPDGSPAMIGAMMDEMLNRLEAIGVKFVREQ